MSKLRTILSVLTAATVSVVIARIAPSFGADQGDATGPADSHSSANGPLTNWPQWTSSRVVGSPEPPSPMIIRRLNATATIDRPVHVEIGPTGQQWFVCLESGRIVSVPVRDTPDASAEPFNDIRRDDPATGGKSSDRRLWSICFHPKFKENGYFYVCYLEYKPQPNRNRIVRYTVSHEQRGEATPKVDPATETLVIEWDAGVDHFGGCLAFGIDGMLYFSAGDGYGYGDGDDANPSMPPTGQRLDDLNASILRIDVDRPDAGRPYSIPSDNPFRQTPGARPEVWAYGLRNVWKFSIDRSSNSFNSIHGDLWAADVGQDLWEPVVLVARGGNYGWSVKEGSHDFRPHRKPGPTPILPPVYQHEHSEARSLTGGFVYRGRQFPELTGYYVYGDYETGKVWALKWDGKQIASHRELVDTAIKLVCFGQDAEGELVLLDYQGGLYRLERNPDSGRTELAASFPRKLSETGLFSSVRDHVMAAGVIPYDVNAPLWSDGSHKHRYFALPPNGKIGFSRDNAWQFPNGTVLVKTFEMERVVGDPSTRRRLETRLLHLEQDHWRGYTYLWNDNQSDADLLDDPRGRDEMLTIEDPSIAGGVRRQTWHYPSRAECTLCHTMPAGFVLGLNTRQMNRDLQYAGGRANQIRALDEAGFFKQRVVAAINQRQPDANGSDYSDLPRMPSPSSTGDDLNQRARAYLDANCAHCHRKWGGGNALFELTYNLPLTETRTVGVTPQHGDLGISGAQILTPGQPEKSLLLQRMTHLGPHRMPRVGTSVLDPAGIRLIEDWIRKLPAADH